MKNGQDAQNKKTLKEAEKEVTKRSTFMILF